MHWSLLFLGMVLSGCGTSPGGEIQVAVRWPGWAESRLFESAEVRVSTKGGFKNTWVLPADQLSGFYMPKIPFPQLETDELLVEVFIHTESQLWLKGKARVRASDASGDEETVVKVVLRRTS